MERTLENNVKEFLDILGEDSNREGLNETPKRVAKAWRELTTQNFFERTTFDANGYDQMIIEKNIQFYTFCEHHLLPFFGSVSIGYIPDDKIIGISKLPRTVDYFSKRLNTQEYFTGNIANDLNEILEPKGIGVIVTGRHLCQEMRGIKKRGEMVTSCLKGVFLEDPKVKQEFFNLTKGE